MRNGKTRRWVQATSSALILTLAACELIGGPPPDQRPGASPSPSVSPALAPSGTGTAAAPNLVVIMTDDQDVASLSVMPQVHDLLADEGVTFSKPVIVSCTTWRQTPTSWTAATTTRR